MSNYDLKTAPQQTVNIDFSFYAELINTLQDGICVLESGCITLVNQAFCDINECDRETLIGKNLEEIFDPFIYQSLNRFISSCDTGSRLEVELQHENLSTRWVRVRIKKLCGSHRSYEVLSFRDITLYKRSVRALEQSEQHFKRIVEKLPSIYYRTDAAGVLTKLSPHSCEIMGYTMDEMIGQPLAGFYADPKQRAETIALILANLGKPVKVESKLRKGDGSIIWVTTSAYARKNDHGDFIGIDGMSIDITARKNLEEELREVAIKDQLTQLLNRLGLQEHLKKSLTRAKRKASQVSIIYIDLDKFKKINDTFGHQSGDRYLAEFAKRLQKSFRGSGLVARIGGDEFIVLLDDDTEKDSIKALLSRLKESMLQTYPLKKTPVSFAYSYGIATYPKHGANPSDLLNYADQQMYRAKNSALIDF